MSRPRDGLHLVPDAVLRRVEPRFGPVYHARWVHTAGPDGKTVCLRLEFTFRSAFLKYRYDPPPGFFGAEARGLEALAAADDVLQVPEIFGWHDPAPGAREPGWILLSWVEAEFDPYGDLGADRARQLGEMLGTFVGLLHRAPAGGATYGWEMPTYVGLRPQDNTPTVRWSEFWLWRRLEPEVRAARDAGLLPGTAADWRALFRRAEELLTAVDATGHPSLVHGDLWLGNVRPAHGWLVFLDPAVYRGHREVDLAMLELFPPADRQLYRHFFAAYDEVFPRDPGYGERRALYQLFYLLVHLNLFGASYRASVAETMRRVLRPRRPLRRRDVG